LKRKLTDGTILLLSLKGIDNFYKRKAVKVGVASRDLPDAVLSHEDDCVGVVEQVARKVGNFFQHLLGNHHVSLCLY